MPETEEKAAQPIGGAGVNPKPPPSDPPVGTGTTPDTTPPPPEVIERPADNSEDRDAPANDEADEPVRTRSWGEVPNP